MTRERYPFRSYRIMSGKWFQTVAIIAVALSLAYNWYFTYEYVHVVIDKGILRGFKSTTWRGAEFWTFKGIPYAKPPVGDLRFKGPEEEAPWAGIRDAISHGNICPQQHIIFGFTYGQEDCLFLNVYTPSIEAELLPVMVWIHGGAYLYGSGNDDIYAPDYFMGSGVILVTINYRLGALGFLSTQDDGAPGNAALKDQVAALRWVQRNIAKFGGDPANVIIFGESAGSVSTHYHLLSPMSKGLFAKAIAQSGTAPMMWTLTDDSVSRAMKLAASLGAKDVSGNITATLEFLETVPDKDIVRAQGTLITPEEERIRKIFHFLPTVEAGGKSGEIFLPDLPLNILKSGNYNKVPYITGHMEHEGYFLYRETMKPEIMNAATEDTERFVPYDIKNEELRSELAKSIRKLYFDDKPVGFENISNLFNLNTDTTFVAGSNRALRLQLKSSGTPIYNYVFTYDGGLNFFKDLFRIPLPGAAHADDLGYFFYHKLLFWRKPSVGSEDEYVINTLIRLWTNFARYGNPTPAEDPLTWKPATINEFNYLNISGRNMQLAQNFQPERAIFWAKAYEKNEMLT